MLASRCWRVLAPMLSRKPRRGASLEQPPHVAGKFYAVLAVAVSWDCLDFVDWMR